MSSEPDKKTIWIAGRISLTGWDLLGVFTSEALAGKACIVPETDFIGPAPLDEILPDQEDWPGLCACRSMKQKSLR